ncbi:MAG: chorismate mutase [Spirochaetaceae bacterium]|jgi:chorismate mutase|nr:chorismate mutase [Spirochaetaceae bacterium]
MINKDLRALRGAVCTANVKEEITAAVVELYDTLLGENTLTEQDLVSLAFSLTPDLDTQNPAAALRKEGRARNAAMMVFQEAKIEGGLPETIRVLVHCYMDPRRTLRHIYLRGAEILRPDWVS